MHLDHDDINDILLACNEESVVENEINKVIEGVRVHLMNNLDQAIYQTFRIIGAHYVPELFVDRDRLVDILKRNVKTKVHVTGAYPHWACCPNCALKMSDNIEHLKDKFDFCPSCGQHLDWSDFGGENDKV